MVDGKTTTFADVGVLLRKRGIDLDNNRFLILQVKIVSPSSRQGTLYLLVTLFCLLVSRWCTPNPAWVVRSWLKEK